MIKYCPILFAWLAITLSVCLSETAFAQADLLTYQDPSGTNYFAFSAVPVQATPVAAGRDVVILFDTSATMTAQYRQQALESLKLFVGALDASDRVALYACDIDANEMTNGFVAPQSTELMNALDKMEKRVPLGATDMSVALNAAMGAQYDSANACSVMYIGEGSSRSEMLSQEKFAELCKNLVAKKITVNSLAVGPGTDLQMLACLGSATGGMLTVYSDPAAQTADAISNAAATAVGAMASAVRGDVIWVNQMTWPAGFTAYPANFPPLRSDRDTMVVGTYTGAGPFTFKAATDSGEQTWMAKPGNTADTYSFLKPMVEFAQIAALPLISKNDLNMARSVVNQGVSRLNAMTTKALMDNNLAEARALNNQALAQDSNDPNAQQLKESIATREEASQNGGAMNLGGGPNDNIFLESAGLLEDANADMDIITQQAFDQVNRAINTAQNQLRIDPEGAVQNLKNQLEGVRRNTVITALNRDQLCRNLEAAIREAQSRAEEINARNAENAQILAGQMDRKIATEQMLNQQEKINQMGKRFEALMKEKKYVKAEEEVAAEMAASMDDLDRLKTTAIAGVYWARNSEYYTSLMQVRTNRYKNVADTLNLVDKAAVPIPDDPPIVYPDAEQWKRLSARRVERYKSMDLSQNGEKEKKIMKALKDPVEMDFSNMPLADVIEELKKKHGIEIQLDNKALSDAMLDPADLTVEKSYDQISLRSALKLMLRDLNLTFVVQDEVLLITTADEAVTKLSTKVYPVADLVIPIKMPEMDNVFQSMGSNSSSSGSGSSSGMGGNNNMMGGNGGGMFNVPNNVRQQALQNANQGAGMGNLNPVNFNAFNVVDDLSKDVPAAKAESATSAKAETKGADKTAEAKSVAVETEKTAEGVVISLKNVTDKGAFWKAYFSSDEYNDSLVRATALNLKFQNKYSDVIVMLETAILAGKVQPWMYEALAIAQMCDGRPKAEYERTLMSAVAFCDDLPTMLLIATYLERLNLESRALKVYREVAKYNPDNGEVYIRALRVAQRINDAESKRWAALGILSLAWQEDQKKSFDEALFVVQGLIQDLRKAGNVKELKKLQLEATKAMERDCVIRVSWTGNADIDIAVEEPGGTVCSLQNCKTTAGGVLLGDAHAGQLNKDNHGVMSETYVCPKGFNGDYKILVKRVWGEVVGGKVNVELIAHSGGKLEKKMTSKLELKNGEAGFMFALADGRRTEPLPQQIVANAIDNQVNKAVLAQQIQQAFDPAALANMTVTNASSDVSTNGGNSYFPYYPSGAVGYQPVIITLPTGTNFMAQAVVSADRRYVRITSVPLFSYISSVRIFNYVTGSESDGNVPKGSGSSYGSNN